MHVLIDLVADTPGPTSCDCLRVPLRFVRSCAPLYGGSPPTHAGSGSMLRHVLRGQTSPLSSASPATLNSKVTFFSLSILRMLTCDLPGCPGYLGPWSLTMAPSALRPP